MHSYYDGGRVVPVRDQNRHREQPAQEKLGPACNEPAVRSPRDGTEETPPLVFSPRDFTACFPLGIQTSCDYDYHPCPPQLWVVTRARY